MPQSLKSTDSALPGFYDYDLAGGIYEQGHPGMWDPTGYTVSQTLDGAQRVLQVTSSYYDDLHPYYLAQSIDYSPFGAVTAWLNGCAGTEGNNCTAGWRLRRLLM